MSSQERYDELHITAFHLPYLRDLGVKVVAVITFDLIYGPVCYLKELSRSRFGQKLKTTESLSEIYTGFARTDLEVISSFDEKIITSRYSRTYENYETITLTILVCVENINQERLLKFIKTLSERTKDDVENFSQSLSSAIESDKHAQQKVLITKNETIIQGLTLDDEKAVSGSEFLNFYGFLFINYKTATIDARFFPSIIEGNKIKIENLTKFVDLQKNESLFGTNETTTLWFKGLELFVTQHSSGSLMVGAKKSKSGVHYTYLNKWFYTFLDTYINEKGKKRVTSTIETLKYIDKKISTEPSYFILYEILDLFLHCDIDYPELTEMPYILQQHGWLTLLEDYQVFAKNIDLFDGKTSILEISQILSISIIKAIEFILFLKSREFINVYRKKEKVKTL